MQSSNILSKIDTAQIYLCTKLASGRSITVQVGNWQTKFSSNKYLYRVNHRLENISIIKSME